jgi:serine/threonine protein kinase/formylglycine-generating enzyme required for sulfatase activity
MSLLPKNAKILEYKIVDYLGSGGFANTYLAIDTHLDKKVAIKEFFPHRLCTRGTDYTVIPSSEHRARFARYLANFIEEARILARFDHDNIVKVIRYFEALGTAFIIMDFVDGRHLESYITSDAVVPENELASWLSGLLDGLSTIHGSGLLHGDIKPRNILIGADGPVLIDFGASVMYRAGEGQLEEIALTRNYAAPEQFDPAGRVDHRIDLFSLGAVFYELITKEKLRRDDASNPAFEVLRYDRFYNQKLLQSVARALSEERDGRFADAESWHAYLNLNRWQKTGRFIRRHKVGIAAAAASIAAIAYCADYVLVNDIDGRNYRYKLLTSAEEVGNELARGQSYVGKIDQGVRFLQSYATEYGGHVDRLADANLTTNRNSKAALASNIREVGPVVQQLQGIRAEILTAAQKFYFDDFVGYLEAANDVIKGFDTRMAAMNRDLLSAYVENDIVGRARDQKVAIDQSELANLITELKSGTRRIDVDQIIPAGLPVVDEFLNLQKARNSSRALEQARARTISELNEYVTRNAASRRKGELDGLVTQARGATSEPQLKSLSASAERISKEIDQERRTLSAESDRLKRESEGRAHVSALEAVMVKVEQGTFQMGSVAHGFSSPPHSVTVKPFSLLKTEISIEDWEFCVRDGACRAIASKNPKEFPVTQVNFDDTQKFIGWINAKSKVFKFRLPSEAEWEYVVKKYGFRVKELDDGLDKVTAGNTNQLGIESIVGNALEWLADCWHGGFTGAPTDSSAWARGLQCDRAVVRGSNWNGEFKITKDNVDYYRPMGMPKAETRPTLGFRLAGDLR